MGFNCDGNTGTLLNNNNNALFNNNLLNNGLTNNLVNNGLTNSLTNNNSLLNNNLSLNSNVLNSGTTVSQTHALGHKHARSQNDCNALTSDGITYEWIHDPTACACFKTWKIAGLENNLCTNNDERFNPFYD